MHLLLGSTTREPILISEFFWAQTRLLSHSHANEAIKEHLAPGMKNKHSFYALLNARLVQAVAQTSDLVLSC